MLPWAPAQVLSLHSYLTWTHILDSLHFATYPSGLSSLIDALDTQERISECVSVCIPLRSAGWVEELVLAMCNLCLCEFPLHAEELFSSHLLNDSVTAGKRVSVCDGHQQGLLWKVSASLYQNIPNETQGEERHRSVASVASVAFPLCSPMRPPMFKHSLLALASMPHQGLRSN